MSNTVQLNICPKCGAPIPAEAPQNLCPRCVLMAAATDPEPGLSASGSRRPAGGATATGEIPSLPRVAAAFPQLEILELIGRGGMGFVFKARQPHLDRFVALKLLPDQLARDPHFAERFNREGRVLARLSHPNIVSVFDFGQADGFCYLMMEYVDGVNLRQAMQSGRFSPAEALSIVPHICEALQYAHEQGILHRDIKPENILLDTRGRVKIADFGIAKLIGEEASNHVTLTHAGAALGTPHYMAPEQLEKPSEVDHRADIYSLGVVFYEMLTGELPLGRFAPPSAKTPVDRGVDELVFRTLEKDRERRFQSAGAVKTELDHLAAHPSSPTSSAASGGALAPDQDFILCPPALPRMAKAFLIYAFTIAPLFWLVSLLTITISPDVPQHPTAALAHVGFNVLSAAGELAVLGLMLTAAWKLRRLRTGAVRWVKNVLRLHLVCLVVTLAGAIAVEEIRDAFEPGRPLEQVQLGEAIFGAIAVGAIMFELGVLLWLRRHGGAIERLLRPAPRPSDPRFPDAGKAGSPIIPAKTSSKAIVSALLAGGAFGPAVLMTLAASAGAGLGPLELLILGLITLGCALAGTVLGWVALHEIRDSQGRLRGLPLAIGGALLWPLLTLALVVLGVPYLLVAEVNADGSLPGAGKMLPARLLMVLLPAGTLAFALWAIHATTRWAGRFAPPSPKRGLLKWVFLAAVALGIGLILLQQARSGGRRTSQEPSAAVRKAPAPDAWVQITIRDVRIRTGKPGSPDTDRWLVLAYESREHGDCDIVFNSHGGIANSGTLIQGSTREVPSTEPGGTPRVEHQLEYRLPDSMSAEAVQAYRDEVSRAWVNKPLVIQPGSAFNLIDLDLGAAGRVRIEATGRPRGPRA